AAGPGEIRPVAMLERQHQAAALRVVDQRRACPSIARRAGEAGAAECAFAEILGEGRAAVCAVWRRDEGEAGPTGRAERARCRHDLVAAETERRQHGIEQL